jgi:hypothetical protein
MITITRLAQNLPAQSTTWDGFGQPLMLNTNAITGDENTPDSGALETMAKLLDGLYKTQKAINADRVAMRLEPINIISKVSEFDPPTEKTFVVFTVSVEVNLQTALNNIIDPTVDESAPNS